MPVVRYGIDEFTKFPKISHATLLSVAEMEEGKEYIPPVRGWVDNSDSVTSVFDFSKVIEYWYLRNAASDPDEKGNVEQAITGTLGTGLASPTEPDYYDEPGDMAPGTGVRPALVLESDEFCPKLNLGDEIEIYDRIYERRFTLITPTLLLYDHYIDTDVFDESGSNVYETSDVKRRVDQWFEEIKECFEE